MQIDHIGYAVKSIEKSKPEFEQMGFVFGGIIKDSDRNIEICFGQNGAYCVELVAPSKGGEKRLWIRY